MQRLTVNEVAAWGAYRKKYGPMNPIRRYDLGSAIIASSIYRVNGGKTSPNDFLIYAQEKDREVGTEEFLDILEKGKKHGG